MKVHNPLKMNDWSLRTFSIVVISSHLALWGSIALAMMGIGFSLLQPIAAILYLTFIPGFCVMRVMRIHNLSSTESVLVAVGLSLGTVIVTSISLNFALPSIGVEKPLTQLTLATALTCFVITMHALATVRDKNALRSDVAIVKLNPSKWTILMASVFFFAIAGIFFVNLTRDGTILIFALTAIGFVPLTVMRGKEAGDSYYAFAILAVSLSLTLQTTLVTDYLPGQDIQIEFYFANRVCASGHWDASYGSEVNGMLSVVLLGPAYSMVSGMNLVWVMKIIYPLLFSLVPVGMYSLLREHIGARAAVLSVFFMISVSTFSTTLPLLGRQEIAELFLMLLVIVAFSRRISGYTKSLLIMTFTILLVVSHYGVSYVFMTAIACALIIRLLSRARMAQKSTTGERWSRESRYLINPRFVALYAVFAITWYMFVSNSASFDSAVGILRTVASNLLPQFMSSNTTEGLYFVTRESLTPLQMVSNYIHLAAQAAIFVGIIAMAVKRAHIRLPTEYVELSYGFILIAIAGVVVPYFGNQLSVARLYHITLLILAPYFLAGSLTVVELIVRSLKASVNPHNVTMWIVCSFLCVFSIFNSGVVYEISGSESSSVPLMYTHERADYPLYSAEEVSGATWLSGHRGTEITYADEFRWLLLIGIFEPNTTKSINENTIEPTQPAFLFLGGYNVRMNSIGVKTYSVNSFTGVIEYMQIEDSPVGHAFSLGGLVYDDGDCAIMTSS